MVEFSALASGSQGNSFFFRGNGTSVLVDAGISSREICNRLSELGKNISCIKAVLITHEHSDHISGLRTLTRRFDIPVYLSYGTLKASNIAIPKDSVNIVKAGDEFHIGDILVRVIAKSHDALEPVSYALSHEGKTVSFLTDVGYACMNVRDIVRESDAVFIEANHDITMLENGRYPNNLKRRILGDSGHLSNYDASLLLLEHADRKLRHVFLSHLSKANNTPDMALATFNAILRERKDLSVEICVSLQDRPSRLVTL